MVNRLSFKFSKFSGILWEFLARRDLCITLKTLADQSKMMGVYINLVFLPDIREMCGAPCRARLMKEHRVPPSMHTTKTSSGTLIHTEILHEQLLNKSYNVNT